MKIKCISLIFILLLGYEIVFSATIVSNAVTGNWNSASSWVGGVIPTSNDSVVIVSGANITLNVNATVYKLKINSGGVLNIGDHTLSLIGNTVLGGNLEIYGTLNLNSGTIQLTGDFILYGTFNHGTGTVTFNGNDAQRMLGNKPTFYHLRSANTNNNLGKGVSLHQDTTFIKGNFIADGVFARNSMNFPNATVVFDGIDSLKGTYSFYLNHVVINSGATVYGGYKTIYLYGNWVSKGTFVCGYSSLVIKYDNYSSCQPNNQTIYVANPQQNPFWNLTVDKSQGKVSPIEGPNNSLGNIYVLNNFSVINGTWDVNGVRQLYVGKNFVVNSTGTFVASQGRLILNGTSLTEKQLFSPGNNSLYKLTINNTGAGVLLGSNVTVTYDLYLTNGIVYTRNGNNFYELYLSNNSSSSLADYSNNSFIAGKFKRAITTGTYVFPVGTSNSIVNKYRPLTFNFTNTTGTSNLLVYQDSINNNNTFYSNYWTFIQPDAGNPQGTVQFSYNLSYDFISTMYECIISVIRGTYTPTPNWSYVLTTTIPASGGNNGTISVQLPSNYSPFGYILGEPKPVDPNVTICDGNSATVTISQPSGYGNFYWYTTPQPTNPIHTGSSYITPILYDTTTYFVAYFNPQCVGHTTPIIVNVNNIPTATFTINNPTCSGDSGFVMYTGTGSSNAVYTWNFGGATATPGTGQGPHILTGVAGNTYNISLTVTENGCASPPYSQSIIFPTKLIINTMVNNASCGNNNGSASVTVSGGVPPYSYLWSNGQTSQTIQNIGAGTYYVTVTDNLGCTITSSVNVSNIGAPTVTANVLSHVTCYGQHNGSAAFTASGSGLLTYQWSNGVYGQGFNNVVSYIDTLSAGTYYITVTDQNNCSSIVSLTVSQPNPIVINYTVNNVTCYGLTNGSITLNVTGGTPGYLYTWQHGSSSANQQMLAAGNYTVTVRDSHNCTASATITVTQPSPLSFEVTVTDVTCAGQSNGSAIVNVHGGTPPYSYLWNNGNTTNYLNNVPAGVYVLNVADANNCATATSVTINQPQPLNINYTAIDVKCHGHNTGSINIIVTGGVEPYQYLWNNGNTSNINSNLVAGNYSVTVTDKNNCTLIGNFVITEPNPLVVTTSSNPVSCYGGNNGSAFVLASGGTPPLNILWNTGETTNSIQELIAGVYTVTITDANNCTATSSVSVLQPPALHANIDDYTPFICAGLNDGFISIVPNGGTSPYKIIWSNGDSTFQVNNLSAGMYYFTITDQNGCLYSDTVILNSVSIIAQIAFDNENNIANVNVSGGFSPYSYIWSTGEVDSSIYITTSGHYSVTVTDTLGCIAIAEADFDIDFIIPNFITPNGDNKNDKFAIKGIERFKEVTIEIYDRWGNLLFKFNGSGIEYSDVNNQWDGCYNNKKLPIGSYFVIVDLHNNQKPYTGTVSIIR
ncbi:MAG: gliding motility-associated C-terminal domain-containing protein [Bacteroidales bacterium]|nr:gliding motility-associated C-terminal domain-containing protein [Bacteroidales bacterium]